MLAKHPAVLNRLRAEILGQVGTRRPTFEDIKQLKFLKAVINGMFWHSPLRYAPRMNTIIEVLRLFPPV